MQSGSRSPSPEPVGGRSKLIEPIGEGTFAVTYRGRDVVLGRTVAVKILRPEHAADATVVARFEREARLAASVSDPNVVDVYDYGADAGTFFIAMRYVPGPTLKQELDRRGRFAAPDAVHVVRQILHGLAAIHAAGIIHRDIKPENVLLGEDGIARVADFGVAHDQPTEGLTNHGTTVGTASYMAPEQARGGDLSPATDLYAVGVILYELLAGRLPFEAESPMAIMLAHLQRQPSPPSALAPDAAIPPQVEAEVMRALEKSPEMRPPSAVAFAETLARALPQPAFAPLSPLRSATATTSPAIATPVAAPPPGTAEASRRPRGAPPPLPPRIRPSRLGAAWIAPVAVFILALGALGALAIRGFSDGGERGNGPLAPFASGLGSPAPTEDAPPAIDVAPRVAQVDTATSAAPAQPGPIPPSPMAPPRAATSPTQPEPTAIPTPQPTASPTAEPTATSSPSPTATATPEPTPTPTPTAEPIVTDPLQSDSPAPSAIPGPRPEDASLANDLPSGSVVFPASAWDGGSTCDPEWYGRPCVALYGNRGVYPAATLSFELRGQATEPMVLTVSGLGDETGEPLPFGIEINGYDVGDVPRGFPNWSPDQDGARGEAAPWQLRRIVIPPELLRDGVNRITIASGSDSPHSQGAPYLLLGEAVISP